MWVPLSVVLLSPLPLNSRQNHCLRFAKRTSLHLLSLLPLLPFFSLETSLRIRFAPRGLEFRVHSQSIDMSFDSRSGTLKFLCSYGGKILPRQIDGKLRYVGGLTRVLAVDRSVSFSGPYSDPLHF